MLEIVEAGLRALNVTTTTRITPYVIPLRSLVDDAEELDCAGHTAPQELIILLFPLLTSLIFALRNPYPLLFVSMLKGLRKGAFDCMQELIAQIGFTSVPSIALSLEQGIKRGFLNVEVLPAATKYCTMLWVEVSSIHVYDCFFIELISISRVGTVTNLIEAIDCLRRNMAMLPDTNFFHCEHPPNR